MGSRIFFLLVFIGAMGLSSSCLLNVKKKKNSPPTLNQASDETFSRDKMVEMARIQSRWHKHFLQKMLDNTSITRGWALFVSGSWATSSPHILIFEKPSEKSVILQSILGSKEPKIEEKKLSLEAFSEFLLAIEKAQNLGHYEPISYDGIDYEYLAAEKLVNSELFARKKHVFIHSPSSQDDNSSGHLELIQAFRAQQK